MKAICLLCKKPNINACDFFNKFKEFKVFIMIDDNLNSYKSYINKYKNIKFLKMSNQKCINMGFFNSAYEIMKHRNVSNVISWDKALYYFSLYNYYDFIWFMEDDVFFYNEQTLLSIHNKHKNADLVSTKFNINNVYNKNEWHWNIIDVPNEYKNCCANLMVCCIRLSKKFLYKIKEHVKKYKKLYLIEALIPTLVRYNKLKYKIDKRLIISWNTKFNKLNRNFIYHPLKSINYYNLFRNELLYYETIYI